MYVKGEITIINSINTLFNNYNMFFLPHITADSFLFGDYLKADNNFNEILSSYFNDENIASALINDEIYPIGVIDNCIFLFDCILGMPYVIKDKEGFCIYDYMLSMQHDIKEACDLRSLLNRRSNRIVTCREIDIPSIKDKYGMSYKGYPTKQLFEPMPVYEVGSIKELEEIIDYIKSVIPNKIWYRGQVNEYKLNRSLTSITTLGLPETFTETPSLLPSLARTNIFGLGEKYIRWMEAYNIWLASENDEFVAKHNDKYKEILELLNDLRKMPDYCGHLWQDNNMPIEIEELLCGDSSLYQAGVLCMQQYGMLTSYLDITEDIDIALYFTQSKLNKNTNKFEKIAPTKERVIYLFPELKNTCTLTNLHDVYKLPLSWDYSIPKRLINQRCGILSGASFSHKNNYAHRILAKIVLKSDSIVSSKETADLFPNETNDSFFSMLSRAKPQLYGLYG
jgi:hypothetical protein